MSSTGSKAGGKPLTPPDLTRCQAERTEEEPFRIGAPRRWHRCTNAPTVIATENEAGPDGLVGSMSLCPGCKAEFEKRRPAGYARFEPIGAAPKRDQR